MKNLILILLFPIFINAQVEYFTALNFQNNIRSYYNLDLLSYDKELSNKAQAWANHIAATNNFTREDDLYGETIYALDKEYYNQQVNYILDAVVHWTLSEDDNRVPFYQMIYPDISKVGFGISENAESIFVVAKYDKIYQ